MSPLLSVLLGWIGLQIIVGLFIGWRMYPDLDRDPTDFEVAAMIAAGSPLLPGVLFGMLASRLRRWLGEPDRVAQALRKAGSK